MATSPITLWFDPACSKCREAARLLDLQGVEVRRREYLTDPPTRQELETLLDKLGTDDPHEIMRTSEPEYVARGLTNAKRSELLEAIVAEPKLLQRPIAVLGGRALIARPPERVSDLLNLDADADADADAD